MYCLQSTQTNFFFIGKLHIAPNGFWTHDLTLHPFLWENKAPFEIYSSLDKLLKQT